MASLKKLSPVTKAPQEEEKKEKVDPEESKKVEAPVQDVIVLGNEQQEEATAEKDPKVKAEVQLYFYLWGFAFGEYWPSESISCRFHPTLAVNITVFTFNQSGGQPLRYHQPSSLHQFGGQPLRYH